MPSKKRTKSLGQFLATASSKKAIRARIFLIGSERGMRQTEIEQVVTADLKYLDDGVILKFVADHGISLHWLLTGDLRYLQPMRRSSLNL